MMKIVITIVAATIWLAMKALPPFRSRLSYVISRRAWPSFDCELCVGQNYGEGCYCMYHDAMAPCTPANGWVMFWRAVHNRLFGINSHELDKFQ